MLVSIIIPTYNRAASLRRTLESIYAHKDWGSCEIIVVDNGSTDETALVAKPFQQDTPELRYYHDSVPGLLTGRHLGASVAHGDILGFIDDDVELAASWLRGVREAFKDPAVQLATGPSRPIYEVEPPGWMQYFWDRVPEGGNMCTWLSLLDLGRHVRRIDPNYVFGLNFCIRKSALLALGGFHPDCIPRHLQMFQGDGETGLTRRALQNDYKAIYHPQIRVNHVISGTRLTTAYFEQRAFYQGVCNSFTDRRAEQGAPIKVAAPAAAPGLLKKIYHRLVRWGRRMARPEPANIAALRRTLAERETAGYRFHQAAFNDDPKVRRWVLKKDYWDYTLPE